MSERGWLCVSGSREERNNAKTAERQLRKLDRKVRLWLMRVSDKMAAATQARDNSPKPVALEGKVRACLRCLGSLEAGESGRDSSPKLHTLQSPPCPDSQCDLGEFMNSSPLIQSREAFLLGLPNGVGSGRSKTHTTLKGYAGRRRR